VDSNSVSLGEFVLFHEKFCSISSIIFMCCSLVCFLLLHHNKKKLKDLMIQLFFQSYALWTRTMNLVFL
jgi:hypothetical protein